MITADTLTDEQISARVKAALSRFERGVATQNDREFVRIYKRAFIPHMLMPMLSAEDHATVTAARVRLAELLNDGR